MILHWAYALKLPWGPVLIVAYLLVMGGLVLDLDRAWRIAVGKPLKPVFAAIAPRLAGQSPGPEPGPGKLRTAAIVMFAALVAVPAMLPGGLPGGSGWTVAVAAAGLALALGLMTVCERRGWRIAERGLLAVLTGALAAMMLHRYAQAGDAGLRHYLVIVGLLAAIIAILALSYVFMRCLPAPATPARAWTRFTLGLVLLGLLAALFFVSP